MTTKQRTIILTDAERAILDQLLPGIVLVDYANGPAALRYPDGREEPIALPLGLSIGGTLICQGLVHVVQRGDPVICTVLLNARPRFSQFAGRVKEPAEQVSFL